MGESTHIPARTVQLPADLYEALGKLADRNDRSIAAELRVTVRERLEREAA